MPTETLFLPHCLEIVTTVFPCADHFADLVRVRTQRALFIFLFRQQMLSNLNSYVAAQESGVGIAVRPIKLATCVLVILPLLILYPVFRRQFIKSVDLSGLANG